MDYADKEEDNENEIDDLLKALDGIEQCFIPDIEADSQGISPSSINVKKRPVSQSPQPSPPSLKKIHLKDPRLEKSGKSSVLPPTSSLPLPHFATKENIQDDPTFNSEKSSPKKSTLKPIKISARLSEYLGLNLRENVKSKQRSLKNSLEVSNSLNKSRKYSGKSCKVPASVEKHKQEQFVLRIHSNELSKKPTPEEKLRLKEYIDLSCDTSKVSKKSHVLESDRIENLLPLDNVSELETFTPIVQYAIEDEKIPRTSTKETELRTPPWRKTKRAAPTYEEISSLLPSEILIKIFKYLPLKDRKNVKLVCKSWCDICNIKLFAIRQRFVCCGIYDTTSILRTLTKSGCGYFNLEFYRVHFSDSFSGYWKELGPKIHALYFVDCILGEESLGDVIIHCTEMEHLSFSFENLKLPSLHLFKLTLFEKLFNQRIVRPKLVNIDFQINANGWLSNAVLSNLFAIYPNITRLGFTCHSLDPVASGTEAVPPSDITFSDLWSGKTLTFSPILKLILSPPDSMEKVKLDVHTKGRRTAFAWHLVISHSKFTRLREIVIEIDLKKLSGNAIIEFCVAQPELKSISCKFIGPAKLFISLFLSKLLENCPRLRNLNVTYNGQFLMSSELFRGLVSSKLKSLSIESSEVLLASQLNDMIEWPENEHLKSLSLSESVGNNLNKLFVVIFRKLKFLEIHNLCDELLQLIWKFQTNLASLKLAGVEECTIDGFCGVPENFSSLSIRNLQNLEYFVLEAVNNEWQVYGNVFSEFKFPLLKYLCVDIEGSATLTTDLLEAVSKFTDLEGVSITCQGVERAIWLNINKNWKKLRYLRIVDKESCRFRVNQYMKYFKTSPNLRALFHEFKESTESYYYDVFDKIVKKKTHRVKYRISSVKIANCFVDWLWF